MGDRLGESQLQPDLDQAITGLTAVSGLPLIGMQ
jgi:hypothetical protein